MARQEREEGMKEKTEKDKGMEKVKDEKEKGESR